MADGALCLRVFFCLSGFLEFAGNSIKNPDRKIRPGHFIKY